jgi:hypothetical protein
MADADEDDFEREVSSARACVVVGLGLADCFNHTPALPTQAKRYSHILSEKKRRDKVRDGFTLLRNALPSKKRAANRALLLQMGMVCPPPPAPPAGMSDAVNIGLPFKITECSWIHGQRPIEQAPSGSGILKRTTRG